MRKYADIQASGSVRATGGALHVANTASDIEDLDVGAVFAVHNNDGTIQANNILQNSVFGIANTNSAVADIRATSGADSVLFTATANAILNASFGIGQAFHTADWVPGGFQNGVVTLNNFRDRTGQSPVRLNFRGRTSNEWWAQCRFVVTYTDGTVVETNSNAGTSGTYHTVNFDTTRDIESVLMDLTGINGGNPGIHDFNMYFPGAVGTGLWYKSGEQVYESITLL